MAHGQRLNMAHGQKLNMLRLPLSNCAIGNPLTLAIILTTNGHSFSALTSVILLEIFKRVFVIVGVVSQMVCQPNVALTHGCPSF